MLKALVLVISLLCFSLKAQPLIWSSPFTLNNPAGTVTAPKTAFLDDQVMIVVWGASTNPAQILCSRFENGSFSAPAQVVTDLPGPNL
ncbi:MAG: hypothetical protein JNJ57_17925, partial [Saprospiraceae bacterium]|nr:hypothetical protein [Saprospiraceae bacterium]